MRGGLRHTAEPRRSGKWSWRIVSVSSAVLRPGAVRNDHPCAPGRRGRGGLESRREAG